MKKIARLLIFVFPLFCSIILVAQPPIEVYFSPDGLVTQKLVELIDAEKASIKAAVYCLMDSEIGKALDRAHKKGVEIEIIVDPFSVKCRSPLKRLAERGVALFVWDPEEDEASPSRRSLMHDKFCIFGAHTVWTGSFNFTRQASRANRENVVVLHDSEVASLYLKEFQKIKGEGCRSYAQFIALKAERK